jgi:8-oxo-dGTP diphosphatase
MAGDLGLGEFVRRARIAFERGLKLVQVREKDWPADKRRRLVTTLLPLAHAVGARLLLNGEAAEAQELGCDGVHWTSARLAQATTRPAGLLCSASCHTTEEIAKAGELGLDFVLLGPIRPTPSHPSASPIGWDGFAARAAGAQLPVYALGGLGSGDLGAAIARGAHGLALRRAAWE